MAEASSSSMALARRSADTALMPPPPPPKRIKRPKNVIDEDVYTDAISEIIARDFFPGLLETETQHEYMDALESGNAAWISSAGRRLTHLNTPGRANPRRGTSLQTPRLAPDTPRGLLEETPMSSASNLTTSTETSVRVKVDTNMSLDRFQATYTSEDNESFYNLLDKQNQRRAEKYAWMWSENNKLPSKMMLKQKETEARLLESRGSLLDDGGKRDRLAIKSIDEKPARPDSWKSKPNNQLMFAPGSVEDLVKTVFQDANESSRMGPKAVAYSNTRLPTSNDTQISNIPPSSPSMSAVKDAIAGHRRASDVESGFNGSETPRVNGYAFVDDEPEGETLAPAPIIVLGKGEKVRNPFIIKEQSRREDLHHRIVEKNTRSKRASLQNGMVGKADATLVPKFPSSPRVVKGNLTPAAQRLWSRVGNVENQGIADGFNRTPSEARRKSVLSTKWTPSITPT